MQQPAAGPDIIDGLVAAVPFRADVEGLKGLCDNETEADVLKAIRKCHRGKACGPTSWGTTGTETILVVLFNCLRNCAAFSWRA